MRIGVSVLFMCTAIVFADRIRTDTFYINGPLDVAVGVVMWLGLFWICHRDWGVKKPEGHESATERVAFRLGKALKRIRGGNRIT